MSTEVREPSAKYLAKANFKQTEIGQIPNDWSVASLREVTDAARPISYGIVQTGPNLADGVPCIRVVDIDNGTLNTSGLIYTSEAISSAYKRTVLRAGDLVMPLRGKVGDVAEVGSTLEGANLTRGVALLSIRTGIVGSYCRHALAWPTTRRRLEQSMNGSALQEIPIAALRSFQIALPREEQEQRAISTALSDVDALIAGQERLIAKKRGIKQAAMQQLLTGQTRLPGFSGKWATKLLPELADIRSGGTPSTTDPAAWDGDIAWCTPTDITALAGRKYLTQTERRITEHGLKQSSAEVIPASSIVMTSRATIGECAINAVPMTTNQGFKNFVPFESVDAEFLYYLLTTQKAGFISLCGGSTFLEIGKTQLHGYAVSLPADKVEQTAIATVLSDMDSELAALEARLSKTRAIKQGMMQELLTGRTRLV
jgi:type I restriction enzyme S subunit